MKTVTQGSIWQDILTATFKLHGEKITWEEQMKAKARIRAKMIANRERELVECTSVFEDVIRSFTDMDDFGPMMATYRLMPCFPKLWLEFTLNDDRGGRVAVAVDQLECPDKDAKGLSLMIFVKDALTHRSHSRNELIELKVYLNKPGCALTFCEVPDGEWETPLAVTVETLARLNCRNVKLVQWSEVRSQAPPQLPVKPMTVFKTIEVNPITKYLASGRNTDTRPESTQRFHKVRGHYAHYEQNGLFGRDDLKGVWFIPPHTRGDKRMGEVVANYKVNSGNWNFENGGKND